jgi:hypothetical protein
MKMRNEILKETPRALQEAIAKDKKTIVLGLALLAILVAVIWGLIETLPSQSDHQPAIVVTQSDGGNKAEAVVTQGGSKAGVAVTQANGASVVSTEADAKDMVNVGWGKRVMVAKDNLLMLKAAATVILIISSGLLVINTASLRVIAIYVPLYVGVQAYGVADGAFNTTLFIGSILLSLIIAFAVRKWNERELDRQIAKAEQAIAAKEAMSAMGVDNGNTDESKGKED